MKQLKIAKDKARHFGAGLILCLVFGVAVSPNVGLIMSLVVGIAKEIYDHYHNGTVDKYDIVATVIGGVVGYLGFIDFG